MLAQGYNSKSPNEDRISRCDVIANHLKIGLLRIEDDLKYFRNLNL